MSSACVRRVVLLCVIHVILLYFISLFKRIRVCFRYICIYFNIFSVWGVLCVFMSTPQRLCVPTSIMKYAYNAPYNAAYRCVPLLTCAPVADCLLLYFLFKLCDCHFVFFSCAYYGVVDIRNLVSLNISVNIFNVNTVVAFVQHPSTITS